MSQHPTLGEKALELLSESPVAHDSREIIDSTDNEYEEIMNDIISNHHDYASHYFIQILMLQENFHRKFLPNVFRRKFIVRKSAPKPDYDTTLFSYDNPTDTLYLHWTLPSPEGCLWLKTHAHELNEEEQQVYDYVNLWMQGKLVLPEKFQKL